MPGKGRQVMSENLKYQLASDLGVLGTVQDRGWGAVSSQDCGRLVKLAIERAERSLTTQNPGRQT